MVADDSSSRTFSLTCMRSRERQFGARGNRANGAAVAPLVQVTGDCTSNAAPRAPARAPRDGRAAATSLFFPTIPVSWSVACSCEDGEIPPRCGERALQARCGTVWQGTPAAEGSGEKLVAESQLVVFADYACPFCYLAEVALAQLAADGCTIERRAFELRPPPAPLPDLRAPRYRAGWEAAVQPLADRLGLEMRFPPRPVRTRKAHEAAAFARSRDRLEAIHVAIHRAYFVEGRDIGRIDVLVAIGEEIGLDPVELKVELDVDRWTAQVAGDEAEAERLGITAVPAYCRGRMGAPPDPAQVVTGVRDAPWLRAWLEAGTMGMEDGR
jgi:predicted DsbA family dithiol-disulfide isomerase